MADKKKRQDNTFDDFQQILVQDKKQIKSIQEIGSKQRQNNMGIKSNKFGFDFEDNSDDFVPNIKQHKPKISKKNEHYRASDQ